MARNEITVYKYTETTSHKRTFLIPDRGQALCCQTDQLRAKLPLITDKQKTTPTFYAQYTAEVVCMLLLPFSGYCKKCYNYIFDFSKFLSFLN